MTTATETLLARASTLIKAPVTWVLPEPAAGLKLLPGLTAVHSFRPEALALERMGIAATPQWPAEAGASIALTLPRQAEWACGLLALALDRLPAGATLLAAARNDRGGKKYAALLEAHFGLSWSDSKNHCRLVGIERPKDLPEIVAAWRSAYAPRQVKDTALLALPGVFSCDHVDPGSALLARHLPPLKGHIADFGGGWGYLSHGLLQSGHPPACIDLFEADDNALAMARINLAPCEGRVNFFWHDLLSEPCPRQYDAIVMNPPFHDMRDASTDIGRGFITAAAKALKPGGGLWMVANRNLPYEEALKASFSAWRSVADAGGFKVLMAER